MLSAPLSSARSTVCVGVLSSILLGSVNMAMARDLTEDERAGLRETVAAFETAMHEGDYKHVIEAIPPLVIEQMAEDAGESPEAMRQAAIEVMAEVMATVSMESWDFAPADYRALADGTPYALIPTRMVVNRPGEGRIAINTHTLGLLDGGQWYLFRVGETEEDPTLNKAYPGFVGIKFPLRTIEVPE